MVESNKKREAEIERENESVAVCCFVTGKIFTKCIAIAFELQIRKLRYIVLYTHINNTSAPEPIYVQYLNIYRDSWKKGVCDKTALCVLQNADSHS